MAIVDKVISGGQTGADKAGLVAAYNLGIKTGGTAPQGWRICLPDGSDGTDPELGEKYGLVQHKSREYPPRTKQNVIDSDGTVWIGYNKSPGGKLTAKTCYEKGKPLILNPTPEQLRRWILENNIKVLNVAGNRESSDNPDISYRTYRTIYDALKEENVV